MPRTVGTAARDRAIALRAALAAAGIATSLDPGSVDVGNGGGAWVRVKELDVVTLGETWQVSFQVYLIAPDVGVLEAWDILAALLNKALTVIDPDAPVNTATSVILPQSPNQPLPAFLVTVDELVDL
jgi:hypothetical protein